MPGWVPFSALTLVVLLLLLGLARISQAAVGDDPTQPDEPSSEGAARPEDAEQSADDATDDPDRNPGTEGVVGPPTDAERTESTAVTITGETDTGPTPAADASTAPADGLAPDQPEFSTGALLANVALTQGLFGAILAVGAWYFEIPLSALGVTGGAVEAGTLAVGVGVIFGVVLWTGNEISATVADAVGATYDESLREMLAPDGYAGWLLLLGVILPVIAVVEELLFRAALIGVPAAGFGISPWALAIVSSVAFAGGHGAQGKVGIAVTGGLGFVLAAGYILSGSLLVVVVAHYLVNALEFVVHEGIGADRVLA